MSDLTSIHPGGPTAAIPPATPPGPSPKVKGESWAWQSEAFSFSDILDVLNPLQHIPIVNRIYRSITGDEIGLAPKIAGGTLFGGVVGLVVSAVDSIVEETTGKDTGQHLIAALQSGRADDDNDGNIETGTGTEVAGLATTESEYNNVDDDIPTFIAQSDPFTGTQTIPTQFAGNPQVTAINNQSNARHDPALLTHAAVATPSRTQATPVLMRHRTPTPGATSLRPLQTSVPLNGVRGAPGVLPSPRALAADPGLIATLRKGGAGAFAKAPPGITGQGLASGQAVPNSTWIEMMQSAKGSKPHGASGLASATIAKAMVGYGAAGADLPLADIARAVRR